MAILGWTEFPDRELSRGADEGAKGDLAGARRARWIPCAWPYSSCARRIRSGAERAQARDRNQPERRQCLGGLGVGAVVHGRNRRRRSNSLQLALKLDPMLEPNYVFDLAIAYYLARRHEDALRIAERGLARYPDFPMFNCRPPRRPRNLDAKSRPLAMSRRSAAACRFSIWTSSARASRIPAQPRI